MIEYINFETTTNQFLFEQMQGYNFARALINQELTGVFNTQTLSNMQDVLQMYRIYAEGADFLTDQSSNDWAPAQWHARQTKTLIDKEARFLFSEPPDIRLSDALSTTSDNSRIAANEELVQKVLKDSRFTAKLVRAAKDCFIGKRIAIAVNFNEQNGIKVSFIPSLEFVYETDPADVDVITKFIQFYNVTVNEEKSQQRIYKKKWYMENGVCRVVEELYDGNASLIETITPDSPTRFDFIPVAIVINDGLSGDPFGISDVESVKDAESYYSKLSNKDIDSLRKGTDQITYAIDADPRTTKGLSRAPGAFWDLATDVAKEGKTAQVGTLENPMSYSGALDQTLQRLKNDMYAQLAVPDLTGDALQGVITSGKTMQAIYWDLIVRCNEKMLDWRPAFEKMTETILTGAQLYPEIAKMYVDAPIVPDYEIEVENSYPILQDETEEKANDMLEIQNKVLSRKAYLRKWYRMTDEDADAELKQIQLEQQMLEQETYPAEDAYSQEEDSTEGDDELQANL